MVAAAVVVAGRAPPPLPRHCGSLSPPVTTRRNLVSVGRAGDHVGIGEAQTVKVLAEGFRGGAVVTG